MDDQQQQQQMEQHPAPMQHNTTVIIQQPASTVSTVNATSLLHLTTPLPLPTHLQQQLQNGQTAQII